MMFLAWFGCVFRMGTTTELLVGKQMDQQLRDEVGTINNVAVAAVVQSTGRELSAKSSRPDLPWTFAVLDDPGTSAVALPGGWIFVTRGQVAELQSQHELAVVLASQIAHVVLRHPPVEDGYSPRQQRRAGKKAQALLLDLGWADPPGLQDVDYLWSLQDLAVGSEAHIEIFELRFPVSMVDFVAVHGGPMSVQRLAQLNGVDPDLVLPAGTLIKRVISDVSMP